MTVRLPGSYFLDIDFFLQYSCSVMFRRITYVCFIFSCYSIICVNDVARDYFTYQEPGNCKAFGR